jgi:hypothetical protein
MLVTELVHAADDLFGVPLTVINNTAARGGEVEGPAVVYLAGALSLVRDTLRASGQTRLSEDLALKISRSTLAGWFHEIREDSKS